MTTTQPFDAIVLAGGAARRLDGADKPGMLIDGSSLLERALAAVAGAQHTVVVGPQRPTARPVQWRREQPAGAGPVAAIEAGMNALDTDTVVVLAADMPWIGPAVPALLSALADADADADADATVLADPDGRRNYLAAAWRRTSLTAALARVGRTTGAAVRSLYNGTQIIDILDTHGWGQDCDTWADLDAARRHGERGSDA